MRFGLRGDRKREPGILPADRAVTISTQTDLRAKSSHRHSAPDAADELTALNGEARPGGAWRGADHGGPALGGAALGGALGGAAARRLDYDEGEGARGLRRGPADYYDYDGAAHGGPGGCKLSAWAAAACLLGLLACAAVPAYWALGGARRRAPAQGGAPAAASEGELPNEAILPDGAVVPTGTAVQETLWVLGREAGRSCDDVCAEHGGLACSEADIEAVADDDALERAALLAGHRCPDLAGLPYDGLPGVCTSMACCGGSCTGSCAWDSGAEGLRYIARCAERAPSHWSRLCPCRGAPGMEPEAAPASASEAPACSCISSEAYTCEDGEAASCEAGEECYSDASFGSADWSSGCARSMSTTTPGLPGCSGSISCAYTCSELRYDSGRGAIFFNDPCGLEYHVDVMLECDNGHFIERQYEKCQNHFCTCARACPSLGVPSGVLELC